MKNVRLRTYKDIGTILVDDQLVPADRLQEAAEVQMQTGYSMGRALVELGFISEWELAKAVTKELGVPFIRLKQADVVSEVSRSLDPVLLHQHLFFILDRFDGVDTVIVAEPPSLDLLTALTPVLGDRWFFLVSLISDVVNTLEQAVPLDGAVAVGGMDSSALSAEEILRGFGDD